MIQTNNISQSNIVPKFAKRLGISSFIIGIISILWQIYFLFIAFMLFLMRGMYRGEWYGRYGCYVQALSIGQQFLFVGVFVAIFGLLLGISAKAYQYKSGIGSAGIVLNSIVISIELETEIFLLALYFIYEYAARNVVI